MTHGTSETGPVFVSVRNKDSALCHNHVLTTNDREPIEKANDTRKEGKESMCSGR